MSTFIRSITSQNVIIIIIIVVIVVITVEAVVVIVDAVENIIGRPIIIQINGSVFEGIISLVANIDVTFVWMTITMFIYRTNAIAVAVTLHHFSHSYYQAEENNHQLNIADCITNICATQKCIFGNITIFN